MTLTLIDSETATADGGSVSGTLSRESTELATDFAFYVRGDANSADVTVEFELLPLDRDTANDDHWYHAREDDKKNADITEGEVYHPETRGAKEVRITVTNNGTSDTVVTVEADDYIV